MTMIAESTLARAGTYYVWGDGMGPDSAYRVMIADGALPSPEARIAAEHHGLNHEKLGARRLYAIEWHPFDPEQLFLWLEEGRGIIGYCRAESR